MVLIIFAGKGKEAHMVEFVCLLKILPPIQFYTIPQSDLSKPIGSFYAQTDSPGTSTITLLGDFNKLSTL